MNNEDQAEPIQDLREEIQRDVRRRPSAVDRRPPPKPGVSPQAVVASVLGSLFVGAAGMSLYDTTTNAPADSAAPQVDVRADLQAAMSPYNEQLDKVEQTLASVRQNATEDSKAQAALLNGLAESMRNLQDSATTQNAALHQRVDLLADELADTIADEVRASGDSKVAVRPTNPGSPPPAVQQATAETEATIAGDDQLAVGANTASDAQAKLGTAAKKPDSAATKDLVAVNKPAPDANAAERGELILDNPSQFDLNLLINGEPLAIKARGVTTIDVTVGTVKTQIASAPDFAQTWDKWETVDGVKRLTIKVESGSEYYKLVAAN